MARSPTARGIGRRAKAIRGAARLSLVGVAKAARIDPGNLSKLENGKGPDSIGTAVLARLAKALSVPPAALLDDDAAAACIAARDSDQHPTQD